MAEGFFVRGDENAVWVEQGWGAARFLLRVVGSGKRFDQGDWQADNGVGGAVDQAQGQQAVLQSATPCFAPPGPCCQVGVDGMLGEVVHENAAFCVSVPDAPAGWCRSVWQPEAHAGEDAMGSSSDCTDHPAGVCCVGRLTEWFVVEVAERVTRQNGPVAWRRH